MFACATDEQKIFAVGGINTDKSEMTECEVFDIKQNLWVELPRLNNPKSSGSLISINQSFLYLFGGYPISVTSIEAFHSSFSAWKTVSVQEGDHYIHPFWAGSHLSDNLDGSIFIFGGGLKYNDTTEVYDYNAD